MSRDAVGSADRSPVLRHAQDPLALEACFPVIRQLRPGLRDAADWLDRVEEMGAHGYRVLAAWSAGQVLAVAGYRIARNLIHDRFLFVDDLVTAAPMRGAGLGARLLAELARIAVEQGCGRLVLDTAASNAGARRFYTRQGLHEAVAGFVKPLGPGA